MSGPATDSSAAEESSSREASTLPTRVRVAIVGSGFSGLGMAIRLRQAGLDDFVVLEQAEEIGGTWHYNTYPGCGCDVPSHLYSFSFAPNPDWERTYSTQPEIRAYLRRCAEQFGIEPHLRLRTEMTEAAWDDARQCWQVGTSRGTFAAQTLVAGMGPLHVPRIPAMPGLENFTGTTFHSARWNHEHDLTGERVASIGTGASAIQYVPAIADRTRQLYVFQRTPPWVLPHTDRPITAFERRLYRVLPAAQRLARLGVYLGRETLVLGFVKNPRLMRIVEAVARNHMRRQISDRRLRRKVTPDYTIGCKRILPSNQWYPALTRPDVELVTEGVEEIRERSIVSSDGTERPVDTIIFGTGFHVTDMPAAAHIRGRAGKRLSDVFAGSPQAHLGTTVTGFPNMFLLLGPNTGLGHTSMVYMIESQLNYVMDALRHMDERGFRTLEVRRDTQNVFVRGVDAQNEGTVWNSGCASWYLDENGRNATLWPDWTWRFRMRTGRFDPNQHRLGTGTDNGVATPRHRSTEMRD